MPTRILREGILTSPRVDKLRPHAELFYRRLMSVVDDYGRYYAHPRLLRSACYPLRVDVVREADISRWLAEVQTAGLIALYAVNSTRYLEMIDFRQLRRTTKSKFPARDPCEANKNTHSAAPYTCTNSSSGKRGPGEKTKTILIPTLDEVREYCREIKSRVNPQEFYSFYTANGWVQGKDCKPIKDWKAAVDYWESNGRQKANGRLKHKTDSDAVDYLRTNKQVPEGCYLGVELNDKLVSLGFDGLSQSEQRIAIDKCKRALDHTR